MTFSQKMPPAEDGFLAGRELAELDMILKIADNLYGSWLQRAPRPTVRMAAMQKFLIAGRAYLASLAVEDGPL